jgi:hypothetical protein
MALSTATGGAMLGMVDLFYIAGIVGFSLLIVDRGIAIYHGLRRVSVQDQLIEHTRSWLAMAKEIECHQTQIIERVAKLEGACAAHRGWEGRQNE